MILAFFLSTTVLRAQEEVLARQLANPIASVISVPFRASWDFGIGVNDASRFTLNRQRVIPLSINDD